MCSRAAPGQRREDRHAREQPQLLRLRRRGRGVDLRDRPSEQHHEHGQEEPGDDQRVLEPEEIAQHRREQAPDAERGEQEELKHAEHPSEHLVRYRALHERVAGNVNQRVAGAHHREQHERYTDRRPQPEHGERQPPEQQAEEKAGAEPPRTCQAQRADGTHQRSHAEGGVEVPDPRVAHVEQLDRHDDEKDEHQARDERLCSEQPQQHAQLLVPEDDAEARQAFAEDRRRLDFLRRLGPRGPSSGE